MLENGEHISSFRNQHPTGSQRRYADGVLCIVFSPGGRLFASGGRYGSIHLWNAVNGEHLNTIFNRDMNGDKVGHTSKIDTIAFSSDGLILASGSSDGTVLLWKLDETTP